MEILQKKGKDKIVAYAISRKDEGSSLLAILFVVPKWLNETRSEYAKDPKTYAIINNHAHSLKFEWKHDII